ncbi:MAG: hypothetical protein P3M75_00315 [Candidatus Hodgkinia cicadicola]|nr:MAG: hypothetical protein P3M75_00315 [Candidatus Hodgkinia cicadicola]
MTCVKAVPFKVKGVYNNTRALVASSRKAVLDALGMKDVTIKLMRSKILTMW